MRHFEEIDDNVEQDTINWERYIKELSKVVWEMFRATGAMFVQEPLRFINMYMASNVSGGSVFGGVQARFAKGIMEWKVMQNLRAVSGYRTLFRQWHQTSTTALGQVRSSYEAIVHRLGKDIDYGKEMEKIVTGLRADYGEEFDMASGDVSNVLIDNAESLAYDKA